jgi:xanthine/CO dehydrogenase XdhC/CoxF family maturation factor
MGMRRTLLTEHGEFVVHSVAHLGNQRAVVDARAVFVANTGNARVDDGIALAALGACIDVGLLAWPDLGADYDDLG